MNVRLSAVSKLRILTAIRSKFRGITLMANNTIINGGAKPNPVHVGPAPICSFSDGALDAPLKSLSFSIAPSQSGSGDPSPSNIRPISGWSQVDGKQSGEDMTDYTPITIALGQTVYGAREDALAGKMMIDQVKVTLNGTQTISLANWRPTATGVGWLYSQSALGNKVYTSDQTVPKIVSNKLKTVNYATAFGATQDNIVSSVAQANGISSYGLAVRISDTSLTTTAAINAYLAANPIDVVYELATPIEVDLTPVSVSSLLGQNNIWCNTGETELDYYPAAASLVAVQNRSSKVYTSIPLGKIRYETYQITPQQAIDLDSYRAETGTLIRNVVGSKCKLEFNTPIMSDSEWNAVWNIISAGFNNNTEKKLKLRYYDTLSATYKTGFFYVPDVQTQIRNIDESTGKIMYNEIRVAFIEY